MAIDKIIAEYRLELDGLKKDISDLKGQLKTVDDSVNKSADNTSKKFDDIGNQVSGKLSSAFTKLGGVIAAAFAVEKIGAFISQSIELAAKAEGIKRAFDALNNPNLLSELREATKGTVSDLQLMQTAVKAANFKLPLDQLAKYLKFAQQRAIETGESIDYLVESIVLGISRKSIPILDNLGISAQQIQDEFKKTGDFAQAVGAIIEQSMGGAADATLTLSERQAQLRAEIENTQVEIGNKLLPAMNTLVTTTEKLVTGWSMLPKYIKLAFDFDGDFQRQIINNKKAKDTFEEYLDKVKEFSTDDDIKFFTRSFTDSLNNQAEAIRQNMKTVDASTKVVMQDQIDTIKNLIGYINDYRDSLLKTDDTTKSLGGDTKETTQQVWGLGQALLQLAAHALDASDALGGSGNQTGSARGAFGVARTEAEKLREELEKLNTVFKDGIPSATTEGLTSSLETWDNYTNALLSLFDSYNQAYTNGSNYRLSVLQSELEKGNLTQEQFDDKKRDILRAEAKREKAFSLLSISLSTARAVMSALGTVPPNPALAVLAGVTGAVQLGVAAAAQIPAFKDGVIGLNGKGTETSDSNLALLSKGESVITARATRKHRDALEAIQKDNFDDYVMKVYLKQIQGKQKEANSHLDEWLYRSYLAQQKLINATERQGDKVSNAVREIPKRHRFA